MHLKTTTDLKSQQSKLKQQVRVRTDIGVVFSDKVKIELSKISSVRS